MNLRRRDILKLLPWLVAEEGFAQTAKLRGASQARGIASAARTYAYFVDPANGNDLNTGLSPAAAFKTLGKLVSASVPTTDAVALAFGSNWFPCYPWSNLVFAWECARALANSGKTVTDLVAGGGNNDMTLGKDAGGTNAPTWSSATGLTFNGTNSLCTFNGTNSLCKSLTSPALANFSLYLVYSSTTQPANSPRLITQQGGGIFWFQDTINTGGINGSPETRWTYGNVAAQVSKSLYHDGNFHVLTITYDGTTFYHYEDGAQLWWATASGGSSTPSGLYIGAADASGDQTLPASLDSCYLYSAAHSQSTVQQVVTAIQARLRMQGQAGISFPEILAFEGDSLTDGYNVNPPSTLVYGTASGFSPALPAGSGVYNLGWRSQKIADLRAWMPQRVTPLLAFTTGKKILHVWGGTNDLSVGSPNLTNIENAIAGYCSDAKAAGWTKVVIATLIDRTPTGNANSNIRANLATVNAWIRANYTNWAAGLDDLGAISGMNPTSTNDYAGSYYQSDGIHLNASGVAAAVPTAIAALQPLI